MSEQAKVQLSAMHTKIPTEAQPIWVSALNTALAKGASHEEATALADAAVWQWLKDNGKENPYLTAQDRADLSIFRAIASVKGVESGKEYAVISVGANVVVVQPTSGGASIELTDWEFQQVSGNEIQRAVTVDGKTKRAVWQEVGDGDYVDFGAYGKLYVCSTQGFNGRWRVTDNEADRDNPNASGWFIDPESAKSIIEKRNRSPVEQLWQGIQRVFAPFVKRAAGSKEYIEGQQAALQDKPATENPYSYNPYSDIVIDKKMDWNNGWADAMKKKNSGNRATVKRDSADEDKAYKVGEQAGLAGKPETDNPYSESNQTALWDAWKNGWDDGSAAIIFGGQRAEEGHAYFEGVEAQKAGKPITVCPYPKDSANWEQWMTGWTDSESGAYSRALLQRIKAEQRQLNPIDIFTEGGATFVLATENGRLFRFKLAQDGVTLTEGIEIVEKRARANFELQLFDPGGHHKSTEWHDQEVMAQRSGENWTMLTRGNMFKIIDHSAENRSVVVAPSLQVIRQQGKPTRWLAIASSAVLNRQGEIDSKNLFDSFVAHAEKTRKFPVLDFFHMREKVRLGQADFIARDDALYIASGEFDDTPIARAAIETLEKESDKWGLSISYLRTSQPQMVTITKDVRIPVYTSGINDFISVLPATDACDLFTAIGITREGDSMNKKVRDALAALVGDKIADQFARNTDEKNRMIADQRLIVREVAGATPPAPVPVDGNTQRQDPYEEGKAAYAADPASVNPYPPEDPNSAEWQKGFDEAKAGETPDEVVIEESTLAAFQRGILESPEFKAVTESLKAIAQALEDTKTEHGKINARLQALEKDDATKRREWQNDLPRTTSHTTIVRQRTPALRDAPMTSEEIAKQTLGKLTGQGHLKP